jgi:hypothetical protein
MRRNERSPEEHRYFEWYCLNCDAWEIGDHRCFLRADTKNTTRDRFLAFDFECTQDTILQCDKGYDPKAISGCQVCTQQQEDYCQLCSKCKNCHEPWCGKPGHVPNLCITYSFCNKCLNDPAEEDAHCAGCGERCENCNEMNKNNYVNPPCSSTCGRREVIFSGYDTQEKFAEWLFTDRHKGFTVIGHCASRYDYYPVLSEVFKHGMTPKPIIYNGTKVIYFSLPGLQMRFLDSYSFLPMRLSKLPKAFSFPEKTKGYFCHKMNKKENWGYVGPYPQPEMYGVESM